MNPHKNETANGSIEGFVVCNFENIGLDENHIPQASFRYSSPSAGDRARVTFDSHHFSGRTDQSCNQHSHISDAGAQIQDTLARANACFAEKTFSERSDTRGLPN